MNTAEWLARLAGLFVLALVAIGVQMRPIPIPGGKIAGFKSAIIALELSRSPEIARKILGGKDAQKIKDGVRKNLWWDRYFLIAYPLVYATMGLLLAQRPGRWYLAVGIAAAALAIAAAPFDAAENRHVLRILDTDLQSTAELQAVMDAAYRPSLIKWTLVSASMALLFLLFFGDGVLPAIPGALLLIAGLIGLCTAVYPPSAEWSLSPFLQLVPLLAVLSWLVWPDWLLRVWR
jgi:hypothetical protein